MHLKHKGYFGVVLIYTITTIALPLVSRCEPTASSFQSNSPPDDSKGHLTTESSSSHSSGPDVGERLDLGSRRAEDLLNSDDLHSRKEKPSSSPEEKPEKRLRPRMASSSGPTGVSGRHNPRQAEDEPVYSYGDCREGKIKHVVYGKFVIAGQLEPNVPTLDYQSDSSASVRSLGSQTRLRGHRVSSTVESWQRLLPVVECEEDGMTLTVRRRRAAQLLLDRANESSVPLSQLPPQCGYTLETTWRDLRLMAPYYACHVIQKDGSYVLPLLWRGTPVKMSCPVSQISPHTVGLSSLCCSSHGMTVKVHESTPLEKQRVNVRGDWTPLALLAEQCGYTLTKQDADTLIAAPFITCGITEKDGEYILPLQIGKEIFTLACPMSSPEELSINTQPLVNSPAHLTRGEEEPMLGTQEPFPWAPPFYLAPPYYPHPTYHHSYASPKVHASYDSPTPASLTPEPTSSSQLHPPVDFQPDYQPYYVYQMPFWEPYDSPPSLVEEMEDLRRENPERRKNQETPFLVFSEKHSVTPTGFPAQLEAPHFQPLRHDFNPYYHYYHHPKIPLSGKPQNPDSGLDVSHEISSAHLRKHEFSALAPNVQQSKSIRKVTSDQFPPPVSETTFYPYAQPENAKLVDKTLETHAPYLLNPYLYYYYYYFPHISRDYLEAHTYTPSASPCGLGLGPDTDCSNSLGCCSNTVKGCTVGQYCVFAVPDSVVQPTVAPPAHSPEDINASCTLQRLTPDLDIYIVPLDGCGVNKHMLGETVVHLLEVRGLHSYQNGDSAHESSPFRFMVGCSSSADSPGEVKFHVMDEQPPLPLSQPTPAAVTVQLRIAEDESFTSYHPEAHLPLSLLQGRTVYVEVSLKDPSESTLVLLVHSCLAYTEAPYPSGMLVYDGCSSLGVLQVLPTSDLQVRKIAIYSFLSLPPHMTKGGSLREDPEIHFMCLTELCSDDCTLRCLKGPNTGV
ncbi:uncharacterized protein LOC102784461 [Neolamprologus brichardi]|uniref:uncharacterized protein LOC102784461 n=1 Tax=Neolamprologus brichardi TaxID=32507 RepID=UPI00164384AE|nr:uncharacterized protein LOC102784461 [Neolamprologus brichardi]